MRIPSDNLDDFKTGAARKPEEPPVPKSVQLTGEVEVLRPLAISEDHVKHEASAVGASRRSRSRFSWFHRSLALGGGLAVIALILGTGVLVRIYRSPVEPVSGPSYVAKSEQPQTLDQQPADLPEPTSPREEPTTSDIIPTDIAPEANWSRTFDRPRVTRSTVRSKPRTAERPKTAVTSVAPQAPKTDSASTTSSSPKAGVLFATSPAPPPPPPPRHTLPRPQFIVSDFTPTTLVIYVENGVVKTRIEPWSSGDKPSLSN